MTTVERKTRETRIRLQAEFGTGQSKIATGIPFLDHMMVILARYSALDIQLEAAGDLKHHIIEDVGIAMGCAVAEIASARAARYGERTIPMDDALVQACIDVGGRPFYRGPLPSAIYDHWMRSFSDNAKATLHIRVIRGTDRHHIVEAAFKALGMSLRSALEEGDSVFSTKGAVSFEGR
jgi:imidazoleglycerol-phosphate dehydratase